MAVARQDFPLGERPRNIEIAIAEIKDGLTELNMPNKVVPLACDNFELRAGRIVRGVQPTDISIAFDDFLYDAYEGGAIDEREIETLTMTDLIISAVSRKSGARAYVAVEASFIIKDRDVTRARIGADILAKAFPSAETYPAVYGRKINDEERAEADRLGVYICVVPVDDSARQRDDSRETGGER